MAYYARLGIDNVVLRVDSVDNRDCMTPDGIEIEELALERLKKVHGDAGTWVKCSYNTVDGVHMYGKPPLRANFPGGQYNPEDPWYYNSSLDIFHKKQPEGCNSWTLDPTTGRWNSPLPRPEVTRDQVVAGIGYIWNEELYQSDNTKGWVLVEPS